MEQVKISGAREAAFLALQSCEKQGAWVDQAIKSASARFGLNRLDAALAANLCYGEVQNRLLLNFWIDRFSSRPAGKLDPIVGLSLRLGLYQLQFLERIPASAAIHESVNLVRKYAKNRGAAGFANAVLRAFQRCEAIPMPAEENLSLRYSHPAELVALLQKERAEDLRGLLELHNQPVETCIQTNTLKTTTDALEEALLRRGAQVQRHPWLPDCLLLSKSGALEQLEEFQKGLFYVQDAAARLAVLAAGLHPGQSVLDACAAPGGKTFAAAIAMENSGTILSRDLHENKLRLIQSGARRLGLEGISTAAADARAVQPDLTGCFDAVLADVPCSGFGVIRKKPDIRYKNLQETEGLPKIQSDILHALSACVRSGGVLIYSTCTVLRRENEAVVENFLQVHPEFRPEPFALPGSEPAPGMLTLWPDLHGTDGFFIAKLRKSDGSAET